LQRHTDAPLAEQVQEGLVQRCLGVPQAAPWRDLAAPAIASNPRRNHFGLGSISPDLAMAAADSAHGRRFSSFPVRITPRIAHMDPVERPATRPFVGWANHEFK
jgi:hypothetical protein